MTEQALVGSDYDHESSERSMFVTMRIDNQLFGVSVEHVRDVLRGQKVIPIPLCSSEVAGALNLRGRIVTVIDMRCRLKLPKLDENTKNMFVVVEYNGELYSLMVDDVGDVLTTDTAKIEKVPPNLAGVWKDISSGVYKLESELLIIADIETILNMKAE